MKVLAVCAVFAALAAVFLMTNWGSDFEELDTCSKVQTVIFERILPLIAKNDKSYFSLSWERALYAHIGLRFNSMEYLFHKRLMDVEIVESHASNDGNFIPLRIYRKKQDEGIADGALRPILLWIHGGGCVLGEAKVDDNTCKKLVLLNDFLVINVDYRLAPEHIFPTAVHDVHAALQWIRRHGREYGGDISKVIISGESAGGYLTLAVTALYFSEDTKAKWKGSKLRIAALVPIYPSVDSSYIAKIMISNITAVLPPSHLQHFRNTYAGGRLKEASKNYLFTPKHTPKELLQQFPPTIMVVAKHDILAAEGIAFESKLKSLGVSTELLIYNRSIHNFYGRWYFSEGDLAMRDVAFHLRNFLSKNT